MFGYDDNGEAKFEVRPAHMVTNTPATLTRDSWKEIDRAVRVTARCQVIEPALGLVDGLPERG